MDDCVFCKIIRGDLPSTQVYEDSDFYAFLDINPVNHGHVLVVPKEHYKDLTELSSEVAEKYMSTIQKVSNAVVAATGAEGFNVMQNNGSVAGQSVFHVHFHVIPRFDGDGFKLWKGGEYTREQAEEMAEKIRNAF